MTQEEKAKAYDDLLVKLQEAKVDNNVCDDRYCCVIDDIVPELKESEDERVRKELIEFVKSRGGFKQEYIAWLEKQYKQKHPDKVEAKFKIGDWLVHKDLVGVTCCITQIHAPHYYLTNKNSFIKFGEEDNYRPWTIQDAKDGDVLFIGIDSSTCIFKKLEGNLLYSYIISDGKLFVEDSHYYYETSDNVHPATKEQREQLEKAMADAGYTFDFNKKELKKVEQKPVNRLKITAGNWYVCDIEVWNENKITAFYRGEVYYCPKDGYINVNGMLCEVGTLDAFRLATKEEIPQQKSDWSEEDEERLQSCLNILQAKGIMGVTDTINTKWLLSLKDRYTWKPSDEQIVAIDTAINVLGKGTLNGKQLIELKEQLKKL